MIRRVLFIQEVLAQYRVEFYEQLRDVLEHDGVQLELVHGHAGGERALRRDEASLPWAHVVENNRIPLGGGRGLVWQSALNRARGADLVIAEHASRHLLNYLLVLGYRARVAPAFAFWGHGANLQAEKTGLSELVKRQLARLPHWWFAYTERSAHRVAMTGFPASRISVVQNSTAAVSTARTPGQRKPYRCAYIGGLDGRKRIGFLLEASARIAEAIPEFSLLVAGDGRERSLVVEAAGRYPWLEYAGTQFGDEKARFLGSSDVMLMPGLVGLGVIDSFAFASPMIAIDSPFHSPEFEYLIDGQNGLIVDRQATPEVYADFVTKALLDRERLRKLRKGCFEAGQRITVEAMVSRFRDGILTALQAERR